MSLRLFGRIFSLEVRKEMSYRLDFWVNALVGFLAYFGVAYYLWEAVFRESGKSVIGGYTFRAMTLYYVLVILMGRLVRGAEHVGDIAQDIYEGGLSRYIVYPTHYFPFKYAQHLGLVVPGLIQLGLFVGLYLLVLPWPEEVQILPSRVLMAVTAVALANLLYYSMLLPLQAVAFWADNVWSLMVMTRFASGLLGGSMLPLALFPDWSRPVLAALPFRYLYDFPVNTLLGKVTPEAWLSGVCVTLAWTVAVHVVAGLIWRRGMLQYTGVGI